MKALELARGQLLHKRACLPVWRRYGINKAETRALLILVGALDILQQYSIAPDMVKNTYSGNFQDRSLNGPLYGLTVKGPLKKVLYNGKETWILSQMAFDILQCYTDEYERLERHIKPQSVKPKDYKFEMKPKRVEELSGGYKELAA